MSIKWVAFTGDISIMFLHIRLLEEEHKVHHFLWNELRNEPPKTYQLG